MKKKFMRTWWPLMILFAFMLIGPIGTLVYRIWVHGNLLYAPREVVMFMALLLMLQVFSAVKFIRCKLIRQQ